MRTWVAALLLPIALVPPALGQEVPCAATEGVAPAFPCGFGIERLALQKAPALLRFQARVAQARLPLGDAHFQTVVVKLLAGQSTLCLEQITDVEVHESVLNLTIGANMSCDLGKAIAEHPSLAIQVCLGGPDTCLKPIELSTLPYAIKATYAGLAQRAARADTAGEASYAQRAAADRDLLIRKKVGVGYFDFSTPTAKAAGDVYAGSAFLPYEEGGFVQWSPVGDPAARRLHVVGKSDATDRLEPLGELVLGSATTHVKGDLTVAPPANGAGLVVTARGMSVTGASGVGGGLLVAGAGGVSGTLSAGGAAALQGTLHVSGAGTIAAGGLHATGASQVGGGLLVVSHLTATSGVAASANATVDGLLLVSDAHVTANLLVAGTATLGSLAAGSVAVDGPLSAATASLDGTWSAGGAVDVTGALTTGDEVIFHDLVTFADADLGADARYLLASGEARDLSVAGKVTFAKGLSVAGDLDLGYQPLLNARLESAAAAPAPCTAATEGLVYLDTTTQKLTFCSGGAYRSVAVDECGNGFVEPSEACDDGNTTPGDGCSAACTVEAPTWTCTPWTVQPSQCSKP